jgi:Na+-translocating ferredoxin:NAD+ oxidoreductase subunit B
MKKKDYHEAIYSSLTRFYRPGVINHEKFVKGLREKFTSEELQLFFVLPGAEGLITPEKLEKKAKKKNFSDQAIQKILAKLLKEGMIGTFNKPGVGKVYKRCDVMTIAISQIRTGQPGTFKEVCTEYIVAGIEGGVGMDNKTPVYRVVPVQDTLVPENSPRKIEINRKVPDKSAVLPIDIVTELVKKEPFISVSDCWCRSAMNSTGKGCGHSLETCFGFGSLGRMEVEAGAGREIDYEEACRILKKTEEEGLVHFVDNAEGGLEALCACCACSCSVLRSMMRNETNAGAPARFMAVKDQDKCNLCGKCKEICHVNAITISNDKMTINAHKCIGCGLCVSRCPEGACYMTPRKKYPKIHRDVDAVYSKVEREVIVANVKRKVFGG